MFRQPVKEINAEFPADDSHLDDIRRVVRESCNSAGLSGKETTSVLLAIEEGSTNIIRHAYLYESGVIRLRIVIYRKLVIFSLIDSGRSFDPGGTESIDFNKLVESGRKGGLGFYMIQKIMDSVEYISTAGFNELRMVKRIGTIKGETRPLLRRLLSLRVTFSFWTFIVVSVIIGGAYSYINYQTTRQLHDHFNSTVRALTNTIADQSGGYIINNRSHVEFDQLTLSYMRANPELRLIVLTDSFGLIKAHSEDVQSIRKKYTPPLGVDGSKFSVPQKFKSENNELSYLVIPIVAGERTLGAVHVVYSIETLNQQINDARWKIGLLTLVLLAFGVLAIYLLSNYFVRPIARITDRVRRFTSGDLETELPLEGAEEFFEISKAFNQMMTRLSRDRKNIIARETLAKEMAVAAEIQKTLLPTILPDLPGLDLSAFYKAASLVSGDLYDVFEVEDGRFCLVVADVSGKGVPASLVMSMLRTVLRIYATGADSPKEILVKVNDYLSENIPPGMFITIFLSLYDAGRGELRFVSAGHNPMLYYNAVTKEIIGQNPQGMPLGMPLANNQMFADTCDEKMLVLNDNDLFFIFTDGLTEAISPEGKRYGMDGLFDFVGRSLSVNTHLPVRKLADDINLELDTFSGYADPVDDISFIIARRRTGCPGKTGDQLSDENSHDTVSIPDHAETAKDQSK